MEEYVIIWRGNFTYDEVIEDEGDDDSEEIYAITHEPPIRDSKTKYIGLAYRQNIGDRLKSSHTADEYLFEKYGERSIRYYLGRVELKKIGQIRSEQRLYEIESAMIYYHYNIEDILEANIQSTSSYNGRDLRILNRGKVPPRIVDFKVVDDSWFEI
ncbi:MAG: hypothetical protein HeimC2_34210 [Candidatus Heimdallarchaeota archaeon LC_2]|nr:MAG: hypothetical protein HeimC2_34210 [Candidatus Heimdallarchaeota archaeon LC_2]